MISIKGLSIPSVVHALYHGTQAVGFAKKHDRPLLTVEETEEFLKTYGSQDEKILDFDYLFGRPIKVKIDKEKEVILDADLYDRDSIKKAEVVIAELRKRTN